MGDNQLSVIQEFWDWFTEQSPRLSALYSTGGMPALSSTMNQQVDKINPKLAWEIGPGKRAHYSLTLSAEGDRELRRLVDRMIEAAPRLNDWEFFASRQSRNAPKVVELPERSLKISTKGWEFSPIERPNEGKIDIVVISDELASVEREAALRAIFIYLDALLGEDIVEEWVGRIEVQARLTGDHRKYPISEIEDYLLWARHREQNPLGKIV